MLRHKDEFFNVFKTYKAEVENQLGRKVKIPRSDRGGEYFPNEFNAFNEENGIIHQCSAPHTPQQNGLAERKYRTFQEMIKSMLLNAKFPFSLWGEAILAACHILNRIPLKKSMISPYEIWKGRKPNIGYSKVWGCLVYCKNTDPKRTKLGPRAIKCAFVRYAINNTAHRLLNLESNVIIESRNVEFFENLLTCEKQSQTPDNEKSQEEIIHKVVQQPNEPRKSQRVKKQKELESNEIDSQLISHYLVEGNNGGLIRKIPIVLQIEDDPKSYKEAMAFRDSTFGKMQ